MNKHSVLSLALLVAAWGVAHSQEAWYGRWEGSLSLAGGDMPFGLTVAEGGALLDLPTQDLYGYPTAFARTGDSGIELAWLFGGGQFLMSGSLRDGRVEGRFGQGQANGPFFMIRSSFQRDGLSSLSFPASRGARLSGTLVLPAGASRPPLVILHAGLGAADRDGNNYNLAGRNDALKQLAEALARVGVASYRYDKRGAGLSTWLVPDEASLSFEAWVDDLAACADWLSRDARFSGVWLLGLNDGATVAAAAANRSPAERGLVVACASADGTLDALRDAVSTAPEASRAEGEAALAQLIAGRRVASVSAFYADALRPSLQPYLIEAFRYDIERELAAYRGPVLIIQGDRDMQATIQDFNALRAAAPAAQSAVIPYMNHVLKDVPAEVDENTRAFGDPAYPVSEELVRVLAAFLASP